MARDRGPDRGLFDLWSRFYDARLVQQLTYRPAHDAVLRELRAGPKGRFLDVGCGTGLLTARVRGELQPEQVVGCDFSRGMLRRAARNAPELELVRGDALHLPFRDASFDAVVSTEAFHWFPDQQAALSEFLRVLAPGGRLLLALVNASAHWIARATRWGSQLVGEPLFWPTRAELRRRAETAGFHVVAQHRIFRLPAPFVLPCVLMVATRPDGGPPTARARSAHSM